MHGICALLDELLPQSPHRPHAALIKYVTDRPGRDRRYAMNITKLATELDWKPRHSLATGLRATVQWYLDYPAWITGHPAPGGLSRLAESKLRKTRKLTHERHHPSQR